MKRKKPSFNETYHGYRTFSELLEDAQRDGFLELDTDKRSRTYVVTRFGEEMRSAAPAVPVSVLVPKKPRRKRRPGSRRRPAAAGNGAVAPVPVECGTSAGVNGRLAATRRLCGAERDRGIALRSAKPPRRG